MPNPTPTVTLRPLVPADAEASYPWVATEAFQRDFVLRKPSTPEAHARFIRQTIDDPTQQTFAIEADGAYVGNCGLKHIVPGEHAELWAYVGPPAFRNRGIGKAACRQLIERAFDEWDVREVVLHVAARNAPARGLYERLGFAYCPLALDADYWRDAPCEVLEMRLSAERRSA